MERRTVAWRSDNIEVATVTQEGEAAAVAIGDTRIIAEAGALADTILVTVLAGAPGDGHCFATGAIRLNRGQSYTTSAASASRLCIQGGTGTETYILVPFHAASEGSELQVEISSGPAAAALLAPPPAPSASLRTPIIFEGPIRSVEADRQLREREARELALFVQGSGARRGPYSSR